MIPATRIHAVPKNMVELTQRHEHNTVCLIFLAVVEASVCYLSIQLGRVVCTIIICKSMMESVENLPSLGISSNTGQPLVANVCCTRDQE